MRSTVRSRPNFPRAAATTGATSGHQGEPTSNGGSVPSTRPAEEQRTSVTRRGTGPGQGRAMRTADSASEPPPRPAGGSFSAADPAFVTAPKALLHDHLDGGLRPRTIVELAADIGHP